MRKITVFLFLITVFSSRPAWSTDNDLTQLADTLAYVRSVPSVNSMRDAGPELTPVKQALRVWVESQLPTEPPPGESVNLPSPSDMASLSEHLNERLAAAGVTCGEVNSPSYRCGGRSLGEDDARGYVGDIRVSALDYGRYMLVVTDVGVRCGFDQSAYIYKRGADRKWKLLLQSEQDNYGEREYGPQNFLSIGVSPANVAWNDPALPPLVVTLGFSPWCSSNWNSLSIHLWRASESTPTPNALIDKKETLYTGDDSIASARLLQNDLLIEFRGQSIDGATLIRSHVEHYLIGEGDKLERVAPVALNPNDFVEEWLTSDWSESGQWVDPRGNKAALAKLHMTLAKGLGEFDGPPTRCRSDQTLWQVSFAGNEDPKGYQLAPSTHFLVRWMAPYRFSLMQIQEHEFPNCNEIALMHDDIGTLFPSQGWTP